MEITAEHITAIGGVLIALVAQAVGLVKYLDSKAEKRFGDFQARANKSMADLHSEIASHVIEYKRGIGAANDRINGVKDTYCKIADHEKDYRTLLAIKKEDKADLKSDIQSAVTQISESIRDLRKELNDLIKAGR